LNDMTRAAKLLPGVAQKPNGVLAHFPSVAPAGEATKVTYLTPWSWEIIC